MWIRGSHIRIVYPLNLLGAPLFRSRPPDLDETPAPAFCRPSLYVLRSQQVLSLIFHTNYLIPCDRVLRLLHFRAWSDSNSDSGHMESNNLEAAISKPGHGDSKNLYEILEISPAATLKRYKGLAFVLTCKRRRNRKFLLRVLHPTDNIRRAIWPAQSLRIPGMWTHQRKMQERSQCWYINFLDQNGYLLLYWNIVEWRYIVGQLYHKKHKTFNLDNSFD